MGSEPAPANGNNLHEQHVAAVGRFHHELESYSTPIAKEQLMEVTRRLITELFQYNPTEASAHMSAFERKKDIPDGEEIEYEQESVREMLKISMFERLPEEYILRHGKEAFDQWIGPYLHSIFNGHTDDMLSADHVVKCAKGSWCPSIVIKNMLNGELTENSHKIDYNEIYIPYANEMIYMNIRIVKEMEGYGLYTEAEKDRVLGKYQDWIEDLQDNYQIDYDKTLFER